VSVAYAALVPSSDLGVQAADDAAAARWYPVEQLPQLAFDHKLIVRSAFRHLACQGAAAAQPALAAALAAAAGRLEGPWQQQ
jgi:8-oxo-dGTP diphosphatase